MLSSDLHAALNAVPVVDVVEWLAAAVSVNAGGEATLEFVLAEGRFRKAYVKVGPINSGGLDERRELMLGITSREQVESAALRQ